MAVSPKGARGVMQVMPETGALYGVERDALFDEDINIQVGLHYLKYLFEIFGSRNLALAAYNCGPSRVVEAGYRIPAIRETQEYVKKVNRATGQYRRKGLPFKT